MIHVPYPPKTEESFKKGLQEAGASFLEHTQPADWALITFGMQDKHFKQVVYNFQHETREVKAVVHYCPAVENAADILIKASHGVYISLVLLYYAMDESLTVVTIGRCFIYLARRIILQHP